MLSSFLLPHSLTVPPESTTSVSYVHLNPCLRLCFQRTLLKRSAQDKSTRLMLSLSGNQELTYQSSCLSHDLILQLCLLFPAVHLLMPRMAKFSPYTSTHFWAETVQSTGRGSCSFIATGHLRECLQIWGISSPYLNSGLLWALPCSTLAPHFPVLAPLFI